MSFFEMNSPDFISYCIKNNCDEITHEIIQEQNKESMIKGISLSVENGNLDVFKKIITKEYLNDEVNRLGLLKSIISMHKIHFKGKYNSLDFLLYLENNFDFSICNFSSYDFSHLITIFLRNDDKLFSYFIKKEYPYWLDKNIYRNFGRMITAYYIGLSQGEKYNINFLLLIIKEILNNQKLNYDELMIKIDLKMSGKDKARLLSYIL